MCKIIIIIIIVSTIPVAAGEYTGIFSILDNSFADSVDDLPMLTPQPEIQIQRSGNIEGWIDVVGFRDVIHAEGVNYVPGKPEDYAIVMYDAKFSPWQACSSCSQVYVKNKITMYANNNNTVAKDDIELKWKERACNRYSCWYIYYIEYATFYDTELSPQNYSGKLQDFTVLVTEYNNTISPKVSISVPRQGSATKISVSYGNATATHYYQTGTIAVSKKNVPYLDMTETDYWNVSGFYRLGTVLMINGTTMDYTKLNISESTPYQTVNSSNFSIERLDYSPEKTWNPIFFMLIGMVGIFGWGIKKFLRMM